MVSPTTKQLSTNKTTKLLRPPTPVGLAVNNTDNAKAMVMTWVTNVTKWKLDHSKIDALPGDASSRRYFRIKHREKSYIVMYMQPFVDLDDRIPFLQVQNYLHLVGVPVPEVHHHSAEHGLILLSDLGDETLLKCLENVSKQKEQIVWFKRAIDLLVQMQRATAKQNAAIDAYGLYFDVEKLMWEVGFTLTHFYNGVLARQMMPIDREKVLNYFSAICHELASQPWVFTHRDYHGRNIMVHDDVLCMIDFQDARLGCAQYDLASLLRDSYYQLEEETVYELVQYYYSKLPVATRGTYKSFVRVFDLMSIQRNFKAIGSFSSFYTKRQDVRYLKFIGNTFENVRRNLLKFKDLEELRSLLFRYYYF
jgi:aminoglycoside/choline kinase family phosphotransferase